jgi:hypothetical protein
MPKTEELLGTVDGRYGQVVEHPLIRGLFYMVIGPDAVRWPRGVRAIVIHDRGSRTTRAPDISSIAPDGWIIVDD